MESILTLMFMSVLATSETHASVTVTAVPLHPINNISQQPNEAHNNNNAGNSPEPNNNTSFFVEPDAQHTKDQERSQNLGVSLINETTTTQAQAQAPIQNTPEAQNFSVSNQIQVASLGPTEAPPNPQPINNSTPSATADQPAEKKKIKTSSNKRLTKDRRLLKKKLKNSSNY